MGFRARRRRRRAIIPRHGPPCSRLLSASAGLLVSRNLLGRVEAMRDTIVGIMGGRREERVPVSTSEGAFAEFDEFDQLAHQFNRLLDDNDQLLVRMREVTDDVAHDLRTPLSRMRARIEATLAAQPVAEDQTETLHAMLEEIDGVETPKSLPG